MGNIRFRKIELEDRDQIMDFTMKSPYQNCDLSFGNLYNWAHLYQTEVAFHREMMVIRFVPQEVSRHAYLMPVGEGDLEATLADMEADIQEAGHPLMLMAVTDCALSHLQRTYPDHLHIIPDRDYSDYIYLREKLATLSGKKLQSKRNHFNKFTKLYPDYQYEVMTPEHVEECISLENLWYSNSERTSDISAERQMVIKALKQQREIGLTGGCIRVEGKIIAFTLGMPINNNTFGVHIEKADTNYEGAFTAINKEFALHIPEQYIYVNREEDLGIEGLRKAKLSYRPEILLDKQTVLVTYGE